MARFDIRVAASALGIDEQWISVVLTRFPVVGVTRGRRGVTRTLSLDAVVCVGIAHALIDDADFGVEPALAAAHRLLGEAGGELRFGSGTLRLTIDVAEARRTARARLAQAVETSVEIHRGRPVTRAQRSG